MAIVKPTAIIKGRSIWRFVIIPYGMKSHQHAWNFKWSLTCLYLMTVVNLDTEEMSQVSDNSRLELDEECVYENTETEAPTSVLLTVDELGPYIDTVLSKSHGFEKEFKVISLNSLLEGNINLFNFCSFIYKHFIVSNSYTFVYFCHRVWSKADLLHGTWHLNLHWSRKTDIGTSCRVCH